MPKGSKAQSYSVRNYPLLRRHFAMDRAPSRMSPSLEGDAWLRFTDEERKFWGDGVSGGHGDRCEPAPQPWGVQFTLTEPSSLEGGLFWSLAQPQAWRRISLKCSIAQLKAFINPPLLGWVNRCQRFRSTWSFS